MELFFPAFASLLQVFQTTSSQTEMVPFRVAPYDVSTDANIPFALESAPWRHLEVKPFMTAAVKVEVLV